LNPQGSALQFEYYSPKSGESSKTAKKVRIFIENLNSEEGRRRTSADILEDILKDKDGEGRALPEALHFPLLTRIRLSKSLCSLPQRHSFVEIRLYAFLVLGMIHNLVGE